MLQTAWKKTEKLRYSALIYTIFFKKISVLLNPAKMCSCSPDLLLQEDVYACSAGKFVTMEPNYLNAARSFC
jgi:hypothetical protein